MGEWRVPTGLGTTAGIVLGITFSERFAPPVWILFGGLGAAGLLLLRFVPRGLCRTLATAAILILLGGASGALRREEPVSLPAVLEARVAGRVLAWDPYPDAVVIRLLVHRVNGHAVRPPRVARLRAPAAWGAIPRSDWLRVRGRLEANRGPTVPGAWDDPSVAGALLADERSVPEWGPGDAASIFRLRAWMVERIEARLQGFPRRFAVAILLGRARALTPPENDVFRRTGTSHVIAVSGFHVTLVAGLVALFLAGAPRQARWVGMALSAGAYSALAGGSAPVIRAAAAALGVAAGGILERPRAAPAWMALALPWLLWMSPEFLHSVSFLLSVGAVGGILFFMDLAAPWLRGRRRILAPLVANLGAQWGTLPFLMAAFGAVSPASLIPNLVAVPLSGFLLPAELFGLLAAGAGWETNPFFDAAGGLAALLLAALRLLGGLPYWTGFPMPGPGAALATVLLLALWFSLTPRARKRSPVRVAALGAALVATMLVFLTPGVPKGPWVAFLDVGQGDASVLRLRDGSVWVVDVGDDRGPGDAARRALVPFLRTRRIRVVDGLILSHRHRDHAGALASFLETVRVRRVFDAGVGPPRGTPAVVDSLLEAHRLWPCLVAAGDTLHAVDGSILTVLYPRRGLEGQEAYHGNLNDVSLVVRAEDSGFAILFAGDVEAAAEAACAENGSKDRKSVV